jgi:predicted metal-dependent phosphoesterase TrpH
MTVYDLHSHSTASDGTLSPAELVRRAQSAGVSVLALTDHDTTRGLGEAWAEARRTGLQLVGGVEVSVTWRGRTVHVLGLHVDPECVALQQGLQGLQSYREERAREIGRRLAKHGVADAYAGARERSDGRLVGRTHFARFLVDRGYASDLRRAFKQFLLRGGVGYVPGSWAPLEHALEWIHESGGEGVIAHPARYSMTRTVLRRLLGEFCELGGRGLEVVSGSHSEEDCRVMGRHARDFSLLGSAGSDYHGPQNPWVVLGRLRPLPRGCEPIWGGWQAAAQTA